VEEEGGTEEDIYQICHVCKRRKPLSEFYKDKSKKFGKTYTCRECKKVQSKKYYKLNCEHVLKQQRTYYRAHKELVLEQKRKSNRKYNCTHKKQESERKRKYYCEHIDQESKRKKQYYRERKEQVAKYQKKYYREHKEQAAKRGKKYCHTVNGHFVERRKYHRRRMRERASKVDLTTEQWLLILKNQKFKCNLCHKRFTKSGPATIDHIIPLSKGGDLTSCNVQALCRSCNSIKGVKSLKSFITSWTDI
jgi:hypothetical protein